MSPIAARRLRIVLAALSKGMTVGDLCRRYINDLSPTRNLASAKTSVYAIVTPLLVSGNLARGVGDRVGGYEVRVPPAEFESYLTYEPDYPPLTTPASPPLRTGKVCGTKKYVAEDDQSTDPLPPALPTGTSAANRNAPWTGADMTDEDPPPGSGPGRGRNPPPPGPNQDQDTVGGWSLAHVRFWLATMVDLTPTQIAATITQADVRAALAAVKKASSCSNT